MSSSFSAMTSSNADSSEESSVTEGSDTLRPDITFCCYNSQSHRKAKFLGHIVIPISEVRASEERKTMQGARSGATKRCEYTDEERSNELTRTHALGNTPDNGDSLCS